MQGMTVFGVKAAVKPVSFILPSVHSVCVYSAFCVPPKPHTSAGEVGSVALASFGVCKPGVYAFTSPKYTVWLSPSVKLAGLNLLLG